MNQDDEISELLIRWEEAWEHGEDMPVETLCADCPQHREALSRLIKALKATAWVKERADCGTDEYDTGDDAQIPKILGGRYRIDGLIAEGGHGRVFKGFDPELQRPVAVKIPRPKRGVSPDFPDQLLEEARKAARLRHPGIVSVHDVGKDNGLVFAVSDLIDGENLADRIAKKRPSAKEAVELVAEIADALAFAHEQGFVHRDVKPANILVDRQGKPFIADFGIAATIEDLARGRTVVSGTLLYMAPEQLAGEVQLIDGRTDVYALGLVLYELLVGRHPYLAWTPTALREQILFRSPVPLRTVDPKISPDLERICLRCLAKHPADRFASARDFATALRSLASAQVKSRQLVAPLLVTLAVLLIAALSVAGWKLMGPHPAVVGTTSPSSSIAQDGVLVFDGKTHIVTPVERFAPVTIEAWVRPEIYRENGGQFIVGSDLPTRWGNGLLISGAVLAAEYIPGATFSDKPVPLHEWSHLTVVFGKKETRLYLNGKKVHVGPKTQEEGGTPFVIGCAGRDRQVDYFQGKIRCVRISNGERYAGDFRPDEVFKPDLANAPNRAVLIYEGEHAQEGRVIGSQQ
jgi:tRNA A-37 threonylcarbamoyl transferase component Bud32